MQQKNHVYFIQSGNLGPIKIGYSNNVKKRLSALRSGSPYELSVIGIIEGGREKEKELHEKFKEKRIAQNCEWFESCDEIIGFINSNKIKTEAALIKVRKFKKKAKKFSKESIINECFSIEFSQENLAYVCDKANIKLSSLAVLCKNLENSFTSRLHFFMLGGEAASVLGQLKINEVREMANFLNVKFTSLPQDINCQEIEFNYDSAINLIDGFSKNHQEFVCKNISPRFSLKDSEKRIKVEYKHTQEITNNRLAFTYVSRELYFSELKKLSKPLCVNFY